MVQRQQVLASTVLICTEKRKMTQVNEKSLHTSRDSRYVTYFMHVITRVRHGGATMYAGKRTSPKGIRQRGLLSPPLVASQIRKYHTRTHNKN